MLYIVSTPIGNLKDMTIRAKEVLSQVDMIASEDTRRTGKLLKHFEIKKRQISFHDHNTRSKTPYLIEHMNLGGTVALVSDSGTPTISDPGNYLVQMCHKHNIPVSPIPGPCAVIAALSASGFPSGVFSFHGFVPKTSGKRKNMFESFKGRHDTIVCYESPYRIKKTLEAIAQALPSWKMCVARELTKRFEELLFGTADDLLKKITAPKGEYVLILHSQGHTL